MELKYGVMIGAETMGNPCLADGLLERAALRIAIDGRSRVDFEPDNSTRAVIHHDEDTIGLESKGLTPKEIDAPQTVLRLP